MYKDIRNLKDRSRTSLAVKGIPDGAYEEKATIPFVILCVNMNNLYQELTISIIKYAVKDTHLILNNNYFGK
jgi:hypothetical protein